ncbi:pyrroline-5-carboxylate reductase [Jatrophihabitans sp. GAS493]|uniref:pyrroline-5-carboxylate reductase family protein n=1 Tax=Jatrophihabitans sp. GAS493 TaxID=1907575 RepID=UPI000BBF7A9F|nr:pyrroline-5-carboxylate reductase dimerization domain-containing protein [Jatrophihabitans sp. GAS493]SOD70883.1 pyrroline-5-carboxylate reductase [Jatrophihabitans sp. GAS493]
MTVGFVGAGNMARAMSLGWGDPILCTDAGSGRAAALAAEVGGSAVATNAELAAGSDLIVLAHKPALLGRVADEVTAGLTSRTSRTRAIVSVLAGATLADLQSAYPHVPVLRIEPNTLVQLRRGVLLMATPRPETDRALVAEIVELFERLGTVVTVREEQFSAASSVSGVGPAYWALLVEAQMDAAVRHGLTPEVAGRLITATMAGTAELLRQDDFDTLAARRAVTSPGGVTARGLAALERAGIRSAFNDAMDATVDD